MKKNIFNSTLALIAAFGMMFAGFNASSNDAFVQDSQLCEQSTQVEAGLGSSFKKAVKKAAKNAANAVKKEVKKEIKKNVSRLPIKF